MENERPKELRSPADYEMEPELLAPVPRKTRWREGHAPADSRLIQFRFGCFASSGPIFLVWAAWETIGLLTGRSGLLAPKDVDLPKLWGFTLTYSVFLGGILAYLRFASRETHELVAKGTAVKAEITGRSAEREMDLVRCFVEYEFSISDGRRVKGKRKVSQDIYDSLLPGDTVTVLYAEDDPRQNELYNTLDVEAHDPAQVLLRPAKFTIHGEEKLPRPYYSSESEHPEDRPD